MVLSELPLRSWAERVRDLRDDPRIKSYSTLAKHLGVSNVTVIRWANGTFEPYWVFKQDIEKMEKDGFGLSASSGRGENNNELEEAGRTSSN